MGQVVVSRADVTRVRDGPAIVAVAQGAAVLLLGGDLLPDPFPDLTIFLLSTHREPSFSGARRRISTNRSSLALTASTPSLRVFLDNRVRRWSTLFDVGKYQG
jgi:hypothetical protein